MQRTACYTFYLFNNYLYDIGIFELTSTAVLVRDDKAADCRCPVRCSRVLYEPVLSNAQLSRIAFDRLFLYQPHRKDELSVKYGRARETAQRVDETLLASDRSLIADVITTVEVVRINNIYRR